MRQASQRTLARSGTTTTRRMDSTKSLVSQESRRRLAPTDSTTGLAPEDPLAAENELYGNNSSSNNGSSTSSFDKLELLGPSLLEVLTLVNPPKPRAQQEQEQLDSQMQQAGEDTTQDSGDFGSSNQQFHTSSDASLNGDGTSTNACAAKFEACVSRSAILGRISDASVDNSRKTQEYFAKILDKLKIEATGLVLLQESTIVLFLETTADQFLVLCRQLLNQKIIESASMRILASCDDNPERILQGLYFKKVTVNRPAGGGDSNGGSSEWTEDSLTQLAVETFLNLIKFVKKIGPMAPAEIRKCLTNLSNTDQLFLPANDLVLWLLTREELLGLDEFLLVFDSPVAIELESERVWPVHPLIHY
ncbi:hypothetical protein Gpo141_00011677 [Globisporangium polare]